jgi:catechol 2,3-dioxygenase
MVLEDWDASMSETKTTTPLSYGVAPPAFRLPEAAHVGAVHLQVVDLQRSLSYYEQLLGLRAQNATDESAVLSAQEDERPLVTLHTRRGVTRARRGAFGLYHFAILLPERGALGRFAAHLADLDVRTGMADHLVSEALYLWDPDGLGIEVYADRPRDTWQRHDRELAMTTDPLDIQSVIAAGRGEPWTGAPKGTTMGHVHLHVGSLGKAEAFYHRALGFDKTVWSYPGALFMSAGGYHHHLGTNTWSPGPAASLDEARLLEWELILPSHGEVEAAARSLRDAGSSVEKTEVGVGVADPWGTRVHIRADR